MDGGQLVCAICSNELPLQPAATACPACGGPLEARRRLPDLSGGLAPLIDSRRQGIWRYQRALTLPAGAPMLSLGEGGTPVVSLPAWGAAQGLESAYAKLEYHSPTGSFKDRGAAAVVSALLADSAELAIEDSSGNAGAAIAAYCARAGIAVRIFVPAGAPPGKLQQIAAYGAELRAIEGSREDVADAAAQAVTGNAVYASHSRHPMFLEGTKTFGLELLEDFPAALPRHLVIPTGNGGLLLGAYKALTELREAGLALEMPRLHLAQALGCAPLVQALERDSDDPVTLTPRPTIAGGVAVAMPFRGAQILTAVRATDGRGVALDDEAIRSARMALARLEGLYVEPTAALAFAAAARLRELGVIAAHEPVLIPATGSGLKDPLP